MRNKAAVAPLLPNDVFIAPFQTSRPAVRGVRSLGGDSKVGDGSAVRGKQKRGVNRVRTNEHALFSRRCFTVGGKVKQNG